MIRAAIMALALLVAASAHAQFGGLGDKILKNKDKILKGAKVAQAATREFSEEEEIELGRIVSARILKTYPLADDDGLQQYVTLVGNTVAAYSARPTLRWHFAVVEGGDVNAFSAPGGYIFITTGALAQLESEAELAAILGHEIAHATQKHILKELRRSELMGSTVELADSTTSFGSQLTDEFGRRVGDFATKVLFSKGLDRRDELEADKIGVQLAGAAGYRSGAFLSFLDKMKQKESGGTKIFATHPRAADRASALKPVLKDGQSGQLLAERWKEWVAE